jgi:hypothetical protein
MTKGEWIALSLLIAFATFFFVYDGNRGSAAFVVPSRPIAVQEDITELRFYPDRFTFSSDPAGAGVRQTGPFNVTNPVVCKKTPSGAFECTSTAHSRKCTETSCFDTTVTTLLFPAIECETHQHRGRPYVLLDSCFLAEPKPARNSLVEYVMSVLNNI